VGQNIVAVEGDVLPAERRDVGKQIIADNLTLGTQLGHSATEINGVPEDYNGPVRLLAPLLEFNQNGRRDRRERGQDRCLDQRSGRCALLALGSRATPDSLAGGPGRTRGRRTGLSNDRRAGDGRVGRRENAPGGNIYRRLEAVCEL
jgi:hypothetical protein